MAVQYKKYLFPLISILLFVGVFSIPFPALGAIVPDWCDFFPTSSECLPEKDPLIIVPGFVGSFNPLALFADSDAGTWTLFPFYDIYKGLDTRLKGEGYEEGDTLYTAYYDWRQSNAESASEYLAPIIAEAKQKTGKVDIVAHSMGGLVVQQYIQSDEYTPGEIDQFIMLGTPSDGTSSAYLPWEGGVFPLTWSVPSRGYLRTIEGALRHVRGIDDIEPKSYRAIFPSLKELLPIESKVTQNGNSIEIGDLAEQNPFLQNLASLRDNLLASGIGITTIAGVHENTIDTIAVTGHRTGQDNLLDRWRDGHPVQEVPSPNNDEGDRTVLASSALFGPNQVTIPDITHDQLPEHAQDEVIQALGIDSIYPKVFEYEPPDWLTGFVVLSPVDITITDEEGRVISKDVNDFGEDAYVYIDEEGVPAELEGDVPKVVIVRNLPNGTYTIRLTGTGEGEYTVIITNTNDEDTQSETLTGTTFLGKEEVFTLEMNDGEAEVSKIKKVKKSDDEDDNGDDKHKNDKGKGHHKGKHQEKDHGA